MAQQVIFAGADLDFQLSGDNSVTLEFSLSLLEKFNWNEMNEDCVQCTSCIFMSDSSKDQFSKKHIGAYYGYWFRI